MFLFLIGGFIIYTGLCLLANEEPLGGLLNINMIDDYQFKAGNEKDSNISNFVNGSTIFLIVALTGIATVIISV